MQMFETKSWPISAFTSRGILPQLLDVWLIATSCVKDDMSKKGVSAEMTGDRGLWRKNKYCAEPA